MAATTADWNGASRRRVERFRLQAPMDVTVLRSGVPDTVPGRAVNVCEFGIGAVMAGELRAGDTVGVEVRLPRADRILQTRAMVRYHDELRCGLEFVGLTAEQRSAILDWAEEVQAEVENNLTLSTAIQQKKGPAAKTKRDPLAADAAQKPSGKPRGLGWAVWLVLLLVLGGVGGALWWKWNRDWEGLEAGLKTQQTAVDKPEAQVPAEVMTRLLVHRVEPVYPAEARRTNLQGVIALDIVVGRDGSVVSMRALNGPEILARAAMDALRWWKFEPYRVNGVPAVVETTVAVEFKRLGAAPAAALAPPAASAERAEPQSH